MNNRGVSGFGVIILIIILLIIGYIAYQIGRVHFTYGSISGKVENAARVGSTMDDQQIVNQLVREAEEIHVKLSPDSIFIDRSLPDSFRVYVTYRDSSDVFGVFTYRRHFIIDKVVGMKLL
ncbi:hypothetical protein A2Y85_06930 [candidate division WOR-3 bacterium RBG_13_43_14]|uniref:DUF4845 domain-containing protein n=1 Tax=candidate division WOR-3 bacterium RBG_13_43_14 TaxID=1802590 RepID=A0A1F4UAL5_UNCW3|nr:MAG: hypothetical protein A2Y85_06930 [candidate division WOR-3 bacterium RBG_13_43_14]